MPQIWGKGRAELFSTGLFCRAQTNFLANEKILLKNDKKLLKNENGCVSILA
jgi:hypothetical protein